MSPDAWFTAAPRRVNPDAFQQFFARQMFHNAVNLAESNRFDHLPNFTRPRSGGPVRRGLSNILTARQIKKSPLPPMGA
jgi:hypothetical protein